MIRIETSKVIPFVLFFIVIAIYFFPHCFSHIKLLAVQMISFGLASLRILVGSLGLIAAAPLTTAIAAGFALFSHRLGKWERALGTGGGGESHRH